MARHLNLLLIITAIAICSSIAFLPSELAIAAVVAIMLLCLLAFHLLWRRFKEQLQLIIHSANTMAAGGADAEIPNISDDNLAEAGQALNLLRMSLESRDTAIRKDQQQIQALSSQLASRDEELQTIKEQASTDKDKIHQLANYDQLTSLPKRALFIDQLNLLLKLAKREDKTTGVLCVGIQNFDRIKTSLGRNAADQVLQELGNRLVGCLRDSDVLGHYQDAEQGINISRLGGDEFAVALGGLENADLADEVAQRIAAALSEPVDLIDEAVIPRPIIGIALAPRDGWNAEALIRHAGAAKQRAGTSRTNLQHFSAEQDLDSNHELALTAALRSALENDEFYLLYQPQVNITYGSITCAEAFLRWNHPEYGEISPFTFVPLAEEAGLMAELGDWVTVEACRQMKTFRSRGLDLPRMSLNVSPYQLTSEFVPRLDALLQAAEIPGAALELGFPESTMAEDDGAVLDILKSLKARGVSLALENFGTRRSSLFSLTRYPLDDVKIDRGFVSGCDHRPEEGKLVNTIIAMADSLGLQAAAEGVETVAEYHYLSSRGVRMMRGYLFSKPVTAEEFAQLLAVPWHFMEQIQQMNAR